MRRRTHCKRGHLLGEGRCEVCRKEYNTRYYAENRAAIRKQQSEYSIGRYWLNPERERERKRKRIARLSADERIEMRRRWLPARMKRAKLKRAIISDSYALNLMVDGLPTEARKPAKDALRKSGMIEAHRELLKIKRELRNAR